MAIMQKIKITNAEIEKDVVEAIKNPPRESEASYRNLLFKG